MGRMGAKTHEDARGRLAETVVATLREAVPGLRAVYLFGSQARGEAIAGSDVDVAVLAERPLGARLCWEAAQALAARLDRDVDVVDLAGASPVLWMQVLARGRRLWPPVGSDTALEHLESRMFSEYARLNEARAGILADIRRRGRIRA